MDHQNSKVLDNPAWNALQTIQGDLALGTESIKRYPSDIVRIMGAEHPVDARLAEIEPWTMVKEELFMVGELAAIPSNWIVLDKIDCIQMVGLELPSVNPISDLLAGIDPDIIELTEQDREEMVELTKAALPGYFYRDTPLMGCYFGIRQNGQLVAMTGERLRMTGFTEVSAVCTHPLHTGKGFAQRLVAHVTRKNIDESIVPFLHVLATNYRAIAIYELLGFRYRKHMPFWKIRLNHKR